MARDTHVLKDFESRLRDAGGAFVRITGKGYRRWHLRNGKQVVIVDLPVRGYEMGHQKKNVEAEIKRALRACGKAMREEPKRERRAEPAAAPVQVAEESAAPSNGGGGGTAEADAARDADAIDAERGHADAGRDEAGGPEPQSPGPLGDEDADGNRAVPEADGQDVPEGGPPFVCERCGQGYARAVDKGRHLRQRHGVEGASYQAKWSREKSLKEDGTRRSAPAKLAEVPVGQAASGPGWRQAPVPERPRLTAPAPLGMGAPKATLVAGTSTMERVAALAEALGAAARELVTEYRLVREENTRLTEAVQQLERMFEGLRRR